VVFSIVSPKNVGFFLVIVINYVVKKKMNHMTFELTRTQDFTGVKLDDSQICPVRKNPLVSNISGKKSRCDRGKVHSLSGSV
jgi:hypothetical protein